MWLFQRPRVEMRWTILHEWCVHFVSNKASQVWMDFENNLIFKEFKKIKKETNWLVNILLTWKNLICIRAKFLHNQRILILSMKMKEFCSLQTCYLFLYRTNYQWRRGQTAAEPFQGMQRRGEIEGSARIGETWIPLRPEYCFYRWDWWDFNFSVFWHYPITL